MRKNRKISIQTKLMIHLLIVILFLSGIMAAVMYNSMRKVLVRECGNEMNLFCRERGMEINTQLLRIEDAVSTASGWFLRQAEEEGAIEKIRNDRSFRDTLLEQSESILLLGAKRIYGAETIYFRYALDLIDGSEEGSFYVKNDMGEFQREPLTQIRDYEKDDLEHVGWYYYPIEAEKAVWMEPYHNDNIDVTMISYEEPVYCGSTLIGLIGMDIDFSKLLEDIDKIKYKNSGYMYLKAADGSVHYHPEYLRGKDIHGDEEDDIISGSEEDNKKASENVIHYKYHGMDRVMVFMTIRNGMRLVLCDSYDEIFQAANDTLRYEMMIALVLFALAAMALFLISSRITKPMRQLAEAAGRLAEGNYDVEFPKETGDEVGDLTRAFRTAVEHLKQYSDSMEVLAYQDALTRVKNVAAYRIEKAALNEAIGKGCAEFAVIMIDLNYMKETNDRFGHSAGDIVLMKIAAIICRTFPLSSVYRIGGDEFTVILKDAEYNIRDEKIAEFERRIQVNNSEARDEYMRISVSYGTGVFDPQTDKDFEMVYKRADRGMYEMKRTIHYKDNRYR